MVKLDGIFTSSKDSVSFEEMESEEINTFDLRVLEENCVQLSRKMKLTEGKEKVQLQNEFLEKATVLFDNIYKKNVESKDLEPKARNFFRLIQKPDDPAYGRLKRITKLPLYCRWCGNKTMYLGSFERCVVYACIECGDTY